MLIMPEEVNQLLLNMMSFPDSTQFETDTHS